MSVCKTTSRRIFARSPRGTPARRTPNSDKMPRTSSTPSTPELPTSSASKAAFKAARSPGRPLSCPSGRSWIACNARSSSRVSDSRISRTRTTRCSASSTDTRIVRSHSTLANNSLRDLRSAAGPERVASPRRSRRHQSWGLDKAPRSSKSTYFHAWSMPSYMAARRNPRLSWTMTQNSLKSTNPPPRCCAKIDRTQCNSMRFLGAWPKSAKAFRSKTSSNGLGPLGGKYLA
mmetsp:Transcript_59758/g.182547  ORF Transcript_59758/g.182547 Transcript_59758/m.182547 type:complete len:232 (-) Transcript_59758:658-1353(-)